ncbi:hypothetical protein B0T16DRAFT_331549 [Cercophora newfieldiana]|uniref:Uncharacterized protein n=1 Tax=Cercophora newfieldiana TaxID=92897 RepID=A0AA39XZU8_9PEZI|nr:hypothetical protein B0T16DRAFT_331549 [Cercophora newfieldiana]
MPGGVCAVLDYDVELMADYVSEMATRIVLPRSVVNSAFRKFVSQILTSTRLPSTTILLGMNYLSKRVNMMNPGGQGGQPHYTEGQVWRMLTTALLLGSKFLDDNTFQNKSWSEVSGIPVQELNTLEYEWLNAINWCLYVNLDESKDYKAWLENWQEWLETKKRQQAQASRERLAALVPPIDTDVTRVRNPNFYSSWHQQQVAEYERYSSIKRNQGPAAAPYRRDQVGWSNYQNVWPQSAPLTPPDSGYGTPEYVNSATSANSHYTEWFDRAIVGGNVSKYYQQPAPYNTFQQGSQGHTTRGAANYGGFYNYGHSIWEHPNVADCNCANCVSVHAKPAAYFMGHSYGQPVVG